MCIHKNLSEEYIVNEYTNGRSMGDISRELNASVQAIYYFLKKNNIKMRKSNDYFVGKKMVKNTKRFQILNGYKIIYTPFHPFATQHGYVCEHRLVMEKYIKRFLNPEEVVHHKNGNKMDNRPENLLLTNRAEHASMHSEVSDFIEKTGTRKCNRCSQILNISEFSPKTNKPFVYGICKSCVNKSNKEKRRVYGYCP